MSSDATMRHPALAPALQFPAGVLEPDVRLAGPLLERGKILEILLKTQPDGFVNQF
jgi:hypothetical protein